MTALHDFLQAAASYFGLPLDQIQGSTLDTAQGDLELVLRVVLKPEDVTGIAARMQRMALERKVDEAQAAEMAKRAAEMQPTEQDLRDAYSAMPLGVRSAFGSFARFKAWGGVLPDNPTPLDPQVLAGYLADRAVNVPASTEGLMTGTGHKVELPPHVYLAPDQATEQQKAMAVGRDARGWYALDPADLTKEQMEDYGPRDAGGFGGLPG